MSEAAKAKDASALPEKIIDDIRKSGFPLELHVLNICSTKNCGRLPSLRYEYSGKLREIDLITTLEAIEERPKTGNVAPHVATTLIIECKKSTAKPWVFFSSPQYRFNNVACFLQYSSDYDVYFRSQQFVPLLAQIYHRISESHYADPTMSRCLGYYEAFRDPEKPSEMSSIYRAVDSVITYLKYRKEYRDSRSEKFGAFSEFYLPVIVLEGELFEAYLDNSEIKVQRKDHLQFRTLYDGEIYVIDIVTKNHFQMFFEEVDRFHRSLVSSISSIQFPLNFVNVAKAKNEQIQNMPDTDGFITMATQIPVRANRLRRSKIKLRSARVKHKG